MGVAIAIDPFQVDPGWIRVDPGGSSKIHSPKLEDVARGSISTIQCIIYTTILETPFSPSQYSKV